MRKNTAYGRWMTFCLGLTAGSALLTGCQGFARNDPERWAAKAQRASKDKAVAAETTRAPQDEISLASYDHSPPAKRAPAKVIDSDPAPVVEYRPLREQLETVGRSLAVGSPDKKVEFHFDTLNNPTPRVHHTPDGHIYVTSGMLQKLDRIEDLAAVLAIEMAEILSERQAEQAPLAPTAMPSMTPSAGPDDLFREQAFAAKNPPPASTPVKDVDGLARTLLERAGYRSVNLADVRAKLHTFVKVSSAAKPPVEIGASLTN